MVKVICPCGKKIVVTTPSRIGRTKYCSLACKYKYCIVDNRGKKYVITKVNPTSFKKGFTPWNKGTIGVMKPNSGSIKKGERRSVRTQFTSEKVGGSRNNKWKGSEVGYFGLHSWVQRHKGRAKKCEYCGSTTLVDWANKSFKYKRVLSDWLELCRKCHREYDSGKNWGKAVKRFGKYY